MRKLRGHASLPMENAVRLLIQGYIFMKLMAYTTTELTTQFFDAANPEKARHLMRFFKIGEGQYGYGDQFLGLPVPATRAMALIRRDILDDTFWLAEYFIKHPHDLMHKASGWMLREAGKKNLDALRGFLKVFHTRLPRTALRYAIERMGPAERKKWMGKK